MALELQAVPPVEAGPGAFAVVAPRALLWGKRVLVVRGASPARSAPLSAALTSQHVLSGECIVSGEPSVELVLSAVADAREKGVDVIIAVGGGSVIDAAKAIAGLLANPGDPFDHLEVVGRGKPLASPAIPWIAVPTTAGTGAEATRNAVLSAADPKAAPGSRFARVKVSLRSPHLLARLVVLDPHLLVGQPHAVRMATAMDAFTQLLEAYVCTRANPQSDLFCEGGLRRLGWALPRWIVGDESGEVCEALGWSAFWSGVALAQAGLGAVHGIAGPLGGAFPVPHGEACAALLAPVLEANLEKLRTVSANERLDRYAQAARLVLNAPAATADDLVGWVRKQVVAAGIRKLGVHGLRPEDFSELARRSLAASSMKANPVALNESDLVSILAAAT